MTPVDLIDRAKAEGFTVALKLRIDGDGEMTPELLELFRKHRDDLLIYLMEGKLSTPEMCRLSEQLKDGATWCSGCYHYQIKPCKPKAGTVYKEAAS